MPYPLEKLPYGLRRRLRELASPAEANMLQMAAPNYYGLHPIQKFQSITDLEFVIDDDSNLSFRHQNSPVTLPRDDLVYRIFTELTVNNFKLSNSPQLILERFRLAPFSVRFKKCIINSTFVQSLVPCIEGHVSRLELNNCTIPERKTVHIISNAEAFKSLRILYLIRGKTSLNSWIDGFLKAKICSLHFFGIDFLPNALKVNKNKFLKFFKNQKDNFKMQIFINVPFIQVKPQLKALFGSRFTCFSERPENQQKFVIVVSRVGSRAPSYRYYVLNFRKMKYVYDDDDVFYSLDKS